MADITLRMQIEQPRGSASANALQAWVDDVAAKSGGRLEVRIFYPGEIVSTFGIADAVAAGVLDLGWHRVQTASSLTLRVFDLPFLGAPGVRQSQAVWRLFEDGLATPAAGEFVSVLAANFGPSSQLLLRTAGAALPQDLLGARLAAQPGAFFAQLGANPVLLPPAELFPALQAGVIDGVSIPLADALARSLPNLVNAGALFPNGEGLHNLTQILTINAAVLAALPADLRQILEDTVGEVLSGALGEVTATEQAEAERAARALMVDEAFLDEAASAAWQLAAETYTQQQLADVLGEEAAALQRALAEALEPPDFVPDEVITADPAGGRTVAPDAGAIEVIGSTARDVIVALSPDGNRVDLSGGGNNRVLTGTGADTVIGGAGDDVILAGRGGNNRIDLQAGGDNRVYAGDGADTIIGGSGRDVIRPGRGDDLVDLREGGDNFVFNLRGDATILGGAGDDVIFGGIGDTRILAGGGNNRIVAGPGRDTIGFVQEAHETRLLDFRPGSDTLDFTGHDGVSGLDDLTLRQVGSSTLIDDDSGGRIVLAGLNVDQIGDGDFLF